MMMRSVKNRLRIWIGLRTAGSHRRLDALRAQINQSKIELLRQWRDSLVDEVRLPLVAYALEQKVAVGEVHQLVPLGVQVEVHLVIHHLRRFTEEDHILRR